MRIWDVHPGYLSRSRLLGEHRELHGTWNILTLGKKGYSRHPEVLRWQFHLEKLFLRHALLVTEMKLRGYSHKSPLDPPVPNPDQVPLRFVDTLSTQFALLKKKYQDQEMGRIPLPLSQEDLFHHHDLSLKVRRPRRNVVPSQKSILDSEEFLRELYTIMETPPDDSQLLSLVSQILTKTPTTEEGFLESLQCPLFREEIKRKGLLESTFLTDILFYLSRGTSS